MGSSASLLAFMPRMLAVCSPPPDPRVRKVRPVKTCERCPSELPGRRRICDECKDRRWTEVVHGALRGPYHHASQRTHCPRGHPYTPENTYYQKQRYGPGRVCKTCMRDYYERAGRQKQRERYWRKREVLAR